MSSSSSESSSESSDEDAELSPEIPAIDTNKCTRKLPLRYCDKRVLIDDDDNDMKDSKLIYTHNVANNYCSELYTLEKINVKCNQTGKTFTVMLN